MGTTSSKKEVVSEPPSQQADPLQKELASVKVPQPTLGDLSSDILEYVPEETILRIFRELSPEQDSLRISLTCKRWLELWNDKHLWRYFHLRDLNCRPQPPLLRNAWKRSYIEVHSKLRTFKTKEGRFFYAIRSGVIHEVARMVTRYPFLLKEKHKDVPPDHNPILNLPPAHAALGGNSAMLDFLLRTYYRDLSSDGISDCMRMALLWGKEEVLKYLFSKFPRSSPIHAKNLSWWLWRPCYNGNLSLIQLMVDHGGVINYNSFDHAIKGRHKSVAMFLLGLPDDQAQFRVEPKDWEKGTYYRPLMSSAVDWGDRHVIKKLLEIELVQTGRDNWTALFERFLKTPKLDKKVLKWLLKMHEAFIGEKEHNVAMYCPSLLKGDKELLAFLIKIGAADLTRVDDVGETLLHHAIRTGSEPFVRDLLALGADPNLTGKKLTPLSMARQRGLSTIAELLKGGTTPKAEEGEKQGRTNRKRKRQEAAVNGGQGGKRPEKETEKQDGEDAGDVEKEAEKAKTLETDEGEPGEETSEMKVVRLVKSLKAYSPPHLERLGGVHLQTGGKLTVYTMKELCRGMRIKPMPTKRADLLEVLLSKLEEEEAIAVYEA